MTRARIRANAALADLARGEEAVVDLTDHVLARAANGLVEIVATEAPHTETHNTPPDSTPPAVDAPTGPEAAPGPAVDTEAVPLTTLDARASRVVAAGTVDDVLDWVGDDPDRAEAALGAERGRQTPRSTLVAALDRVLGDEMQANPEGS